MQVTLIGSGNVATVLGKHLYAKGHTVREVYSHNTEHAAALAAKLGAAVVTDVKLLAPGADLYLLAVTDNAIEKVAASLTLGNQLLVHTAGSVSKEVLKKASSSYGVLWPMKMIRKEMEALGPVTMVTDGSDADVQTRIDQWAALFSDTIIHAGDERRLQMHMLASFTANFSNHLYHVAADICAAEGMDFKLFLPIIEATVQNLHQYYPGEVQAGPAFRGDTKTMDRHLALLKAYPAAEKLYKIISAGIAELATKK